MPIRSSIDIDAPARDVWPYLAEFRHWPAWGPTVSAVEADADEVAPGVTGRVRTPVGVWLPFTITDVVPGRAWDWRVGGVPATGHVLTETGEATCRVEFTAPSVAAPYLPVLRAGLRRLDAIATAG
jgi:uncharacterized protein YndB with AHSA1/START domain